MLLRRSFEKNLTSDFGLTKEEARMVRIKAKPKYRQIIEELPEFEKEDRFKTNIVNCAMLISFLSYLPQKPDVNEVTRYYEDSMTISFLKKMCRKSGKNKFSEKDIASMKATAMLKAADRNPYSWNMDYLPYEDGSGYEARFYKCGICVLMREHGLFEYVPAMCHLDYTMSELGGASDFVREYTLASGGPYCDCGYKKKA
ncbi:L-2-amino-thiazoline-4-carboxylic acid hydrolase [Ruminococcaceae bacterium YAD3003]|nr:L-2-amino-thiazoline-4-carboxylic acid hydrolase [Ruminococcaceae bacterium YAD3003]